MNSAQTLELALKHHAAGNLREAEQLYRQILQTSPRHADALHLLGVIAHQLGRHELAVEHMQSALRERPYFAEAQCNLGLALQALGKLDEAVACFRQAVLLRPAYAEAHNNLGTALQAHGKLDEAAASFAQALRLKPNYAAAHYNLGGLFNLQSKPAEAEESFRLAVSHQPDFVPALFHLGDCLRKRGQLEAAEERCRQALRRQPDFQKAHVLLGATLKDQGRLDEAAASYRQALRCEPDDARAHYGLGLVLVAQGQLRQAEECNERAINCNEDYVEPFYHRSLLRLQQGDFERGWAEYECRWRLPDKPPFPFRQPLWQGENLAGRTILLHVEQGFGDTLQFVRYAPLVKAHSGATVVLECQPPLLRLLTMSSVADRLVARGEPLPSFDVHAPLLSLPYLMHTTSVERIPVSVPYLGCDPELLQHWRTRLEAVPGFRVGIVWQGSPTNVNDRWRSVPLERFAPLSEVPGVSLISLQKGFGSEQLRGWTGQGSPLDLAAEFTDFADTAAVLKCLDLVITVDTSVAHLAGALGVPAWVALPFAPDWRWLLERQDSPWYPSLRLFRQTQPGDWSDVFHRVQTALRELADSLPPPRS